MMIFAGVMVAFGFGLLLGIVLAMQDQREAEKPFVDRSFHSPERYSAMQDTSDEMYNAWGVHKHNPMLDR